MTYTPAQFGPGKSGPQMAWLDQRLTVHGFPNTYWDATFQERVAAFQRKQGWKGSGADGLIGPRTIERLTADPKPAQSRLIEMSKFKRTRPTGEPGHPDENYPLKDSTAPVMFRAPVNGVTTKGTVYSRDELREMAPKSWSSRDGKHHGLVGVCTVDEIPGWKLDDYTPGVVFAQIHDAADDVIILLVDLLGRLILEVGRGKGNGSDKTVLHTGYRLGDEISFLIDAHGGGIDVTVNGRHEHVDKTVDGAYYKAGCYLRGNASNAKGAGQVTYTGLETSHA